jgi:hypothetical protein
VQIQLPYYHDDSAAVEMEKKINVIYNMQ